MKLLLLVLGLTITSALFSQSTFPVAWQGNWKGELCWYRSPGKAPEKVNMELRVQRGDTAFSWQMIYGSATQDNRPYTLFAVDSSNGHWAINEHNGIILDQFFLANRLNGAFTVGQSTILNSYELKGDSLIVEFNTLQASPLNRTGLGTEESPKVDSYRYRGYQRAVLRRVPKPATASE